MKIIFIRHGEPNYEIDSLTEKGWREAELLSKRTAKWNVTDFYCSPLGRAKDTASFTLKNRGSRGRKFFHGCANLMRLSLIRRPESAGFRGIFCRMCSTQTGISMINHLWTKNPIMQTGNMDENYRFVTGRTRCAACTLRLCTRRLSLSRFR